MMIVLKFGGEVCQKSLKPSLLKDIKSVLENDKLVIVHGGGDEVTSIAGKLGKEQVFVTSPGGIKSRYTDKETIEIFTMVMAGKINKIIVQWLIKEGINAVGLAGVDGAMLRASRKKKLLIIDERNRKRIIEGGYTGKVSQVNPSILSLLLDNDYVPVVAPIALGDENELLNVNADRVAAEVAGALKADWVIFLTDIQGVQLNGKRVDEMSMRDAEAVLPKIGTGMDKKVIAAIEALKAGAKEAIISSGFTDNPVIEALEHKKCTVIKVV